MNKHGTGLGAPLPMRFGLHMMMIFTLTWTSCAKTGAKDSSAVKDDSETETNPVVVSTQPPVTDNGTVTTKTPTVEDFLITYPTEAINTATPLAMWNESPDVKDYDIIVSPDNKCKIPLQAYGDVTIHNQQLKPLTEGTYYICVYAIQKKGVLLEATNSPFAFTVDITPPSAPLIHDLAPGNHVSINTPTIAWDSVSDADTYHLSITTDAACVVAVQEYEELTTASQELTALADGAYYACLEAHDKAGNKTPASNNALPFVVDSQRAQIVDVTSSTANGVYKVGVVISLSVTYSEVVNVDTSGGTPRLLLETGATDRHATYVSGSGGTTLVFEYTVQVGDNSDDLDLHTSADQLDLNGGSIKDLAQNDAALDGPVGAELGALAVNKAIKVDTTVPTVTLVTSPNANGSYKLTDEIQIGVRFSEAVYVTDPGNVSLLLETGAVDRAAIYFAGSGTDTLYFNYQVQAGDVSADLNVRSAGAFTLGGTATVRDEAGNTANVTLPTGGASSLTVNKNLVVDGVVPTANTLSAGTADGTYKAGQVLNFQVVFSEVVHVTNAAGLKLELNTGMTRQASYTAGSGTNTLTFAYTVQANDNTNDLDNTLNPIKLNGGATIKDAAGNTATTNFAVGVIAGSSAIVLDTIEPEVTSVTTSTPDNIYKVGESVAIELHFSEPVTVTSASSLKLKMETDSNDTDAVYTSGSGTDTLIFTYTVVAGDQSADLEVRDANALSLNGATIRDAAGNDAFLMVPNSSLSSSADIVIDGVPPGAFSVSGPSNPVFTGTQSISFTAAADALNYDVIVSSTNDCATPVGGSPFNAVTVAQNVSLSDGVYYACITARDNNGNTTVASNQPYAFEVETSVVHVAYSASGPVRIQAAKREAGVTSLTTVQSWGGGEQLHAASSLALSSTEEPYISYANDGMDGLFDLSVAGWNGATFDSEVAHGSGGSEDIGAFNSIALNSGNTVFSAHAVKNSVGPTSDVVVTDGTLGAWNINGVANLPGTASVLDTAIAVDGNDKVHMIYTYEDGGLHRLRYINNVSGWGAPMAITTGGCNQYFQGSLAIDSANNIHMAYLCATPAGACRAYYAKYDGIWSHHLLATVQAGSCDLGAMGRTHKPSIVLSSLDKAYVTVFDEDADKLYLYTNASGAFSGAQLLNGKGWQAVIARDVFDKLYIAYRTAAGAGAQLEMITNNSGAWMGTVLDNGGDLSNIGDIVVEGVAGRSNR